MSQLYKSVQYSYWSKNLLRLNMNFNFKETYEKLVTAVCVLQNT